MNETLKGFWPKSVKAQRRLAVFLIAAPILARAVGLSIYALRGTEIYFYTPSQLIAAHPPRDRAIRLGGLVKPGSISKLPDGGISFVVIDKIDEIRVTFKGDVPDLFREGQGVVCEGKLDGPLSLKADKVLAKHDETYMPKNVQKALKEQGEWRPESGMKDQQGPEKPFSALKSSSEG